MPDPSPLSGRTISHVLGDDSDLDILHDEPEFQKLVGGSAASAS